MTLRDEDLDALLSRTPYIEDAGFTDALLRQLPRSRPSLRVRAIVQLASAAGSCAVVAAVPGARRLVAELGTGVLGGAVSNGADLVVIATLAALLIWGAVAAVASEA
ncbi:MAG TPA: hypothetical protein VIY27_09740 [Myxococcota bacterium]